MADPFVAEIRIFPFNFPPRGWAFCNGQLLPISQNTALFSLLGTTYGGNGQTTFALPNLQGAAPLHVGGAQPGPGLEIYDLGQTAGTDSVTLIDAEIPAHTHNFAGRAAGGNAAQPSGAILATGAWVQGSSFGVVQAYTANAADAVLNPQTLDPAGGNAPHNNLMPYLTLNFCIALQGIFPPRS